MPSTPTVSPSAPTVTIDHGAPIATIAFGGTKGNSLPSTLLGELAERITETAQRADVRVIVLRSLGSGAFCAGASFAELASISNATEGKRFFLGFARVILAMIRAPKPVVTRVQGKVVGGGVGLVAASDYAIAVESAAVRLSELAVGIGPLVVGPVIERKIGAGAFSAMALDASWRDAQWAERRGLYARVCASAEALDASLDAMAGSLALANPEAVARIKATTWSGTEDWDDLLDERATMSGALVLSDFTRQAIAAFAAGQRNDQPRG